MFRTPRRLAASAAGLWALSWALGPAPAMAQPSAPVAPAAHAPAGRPLPPDTRPGRGAARAASGATWWLGPAGVALALAAVGGLSLAARRLGWDLNLGAGRDAGPIGVVGQARLSPKHSVYLVRVGGRVLILGAGAGGGPTPLGEVTDPAELARLAPARPARPGAARPLAAGAGFDRRIGDDE